MPLILPPHSKPLLQNSRERGGALFEFILCCVFIWLPLFIGLLVFGFNLIRTIQVTQVCRDAGHMYAFGTDFSQPASQNLLVGLAPTLNIKPSGGNGVVILSTITYVDSNLCAAAGRQANSSQCPNLNHNVFTSRIVVGASSLHASSFGTPASSIVGASGKIAANDYLTNASAIASNFSTVINVQSSSQFAFVSEMWVISPDFSFGSSYGTVTISARSIF